MRLLLVEDEPEMADMLIGELGRRDFLVDHVSSLEFAEESVIMVQYDAIILDRQLEDGDDGLALIPYLRRRAMSTPVIVLSAMGAADDRVGGLNQGADDYLAKPFMMDELVARIRALLRRPASVSAQVITVGNLAFDVTMGAISIGGLPLDLPRREMLALEALVKRAGRTVRRPVLFEEMFGIGDEIASNSLDAHVSKLRRKLADAGAGVEIHPVRGVGYLLRAEDEA